MWLELVRSRLDRLRFLERMLLRRKRSLQPAELGFHHLDLLFERLYERGALGVLGLLYQYL